mmetsp:Transcript_26776/g.85977  ORF Transcript_26776/g.85977 Transcript_26776/m.85977 type:complete len:315 (+) Transcript_26776:414-1358(+)
MGQEQSKGGAGGEGGEEKRRSDEPVAMEERTPPASPSQSPISSTSLAPVATGDAGGRRVSLNMARDSGRSTPVVGHNHLPQGDGNGGTRPSRPSAVFPKDSYAVLPKFSLFLGKQVKEVYFIRHAEGFHNAAAQEHGLETLLLKNSGKKYWDSALTPRGKNQCKALAQQLVAESSRLEPELVVVSPMIRAIQTAEIVFGPASNLASPPFLCREECRERFGLYTCDGRGSISDLRNMFPDIDYSEVKNENDEYWTELEREPSKECEARTVRFLEWLNDRPESKIAVVTHSSFLRHLFQQFGHTLQAENAEELRRA